MLLLQESWIYENSAWLLDEIRIDVSVLKLWIEVDIRLELHWSGWSEILELN